MKHLIRAFRYALIAAGLVLIVATVRSYSDESAAPRLSLEPFIRATIEQNQAAPVDKTPARDADALIGIAYPHGTIDISQQIVIGNGSATMNSTVHAGFVLSGGGAGANEGELGGMPSGTILRWVGPPTTAPMIHIRGPIHSVRLRDFVIDCQGKCSGIQADHTVNANAERVAVRNPARYGFGVLQQSTAPARPGMAVGAGGNLLTQIRVFLSQPDSDGFILGAADARSVGSSSNVLSQVSVLCGAPRTTAFRLRWTDYVRMQMPQSYYCERSMYMEPPTGNEGFPTAIYVEMASFDRPPTWAPNWKPYPNSGIIFDRYHREWNGLAPWMDSSYGPPMPVHRDIWGTDDTKTPR